LSYRSKTALCKGQIELGQANDEFVSASASAKKMSSYPNSATPATWQVALETG